MRLTRTKQPQVWTLSKASKETPAAEITYRCGTSLDRQIAEEMAASWTKRVIHADFDLKKDLGFTGEGNPLENISPGDLDLKAYVTYFLAVALAERLVTGFTGFTDDEGQPMPPSRAAFALLFLDKSIMDDWLARSQKDYYQEVLAGNASGT